jgi:hypothetical protein
MPQKGGEPLPKNLSGLAPVELVELALENNSAAFKRVSSELERREPCPAAAQLLIEAYRAGRAPAFLVAHLLGQLRAPIGYAVAREILLAGMGSLTESYAGPAMARIAGSAAREDLLDVLMSDAHRRSREGAAYGLAVLQDPDVADAILIAFRAGRINVSRAGSVVASLPDARRTVRAWLVCGNEHSEAVGLEAAFSLSARVEGIADPALAHAIRASLDARRVKFAPRLRKMLEERIAPLLTPTES